MNYESILRERHLKATPQRSLVLKTLNNNIHPTFEELYDIIKKDFPSISLATVYKNVSILKNNGLIIEINGIDGGVSKYDLFLKPHTHILCEKCGSIEDFWFSDAILKHQREIEESEKSRIKVFVANAIVEDCKHCRNKDISN